MATILLQAAGALLGGVLGPIGSALGSAAGAMLGYTLDRALIGSLEHHEGPRLTGARPFSAEEGAGLPRVYGTMRVGGTMIWATRFEEDSRTERRGAKGGPRVTTYSYFANAAFALCEGEIAGVRRIWADGRELDLDGIEFRVHRGTATQAADPLILAKQGSGNAPAYRGTAYIVFERLPLETFGNRVPQFQFEVMRPVGGLGSRVRAVALIPGSTEYGLMPEPVTREISEGEHKAENRHVLHARSDIVASLDELQALCPNVEHVGLVVTWFGDDLRAGHCRIRPKVVDAEVKGHSAAWRVAGLSRAEAGEVSADSGSPAYGGTPSDNSVVEAIAEIRARGLKVTLYPFVMMDIAPGNTLPNPYGGGGGQPAYPWRGRITCAPAPAVAGSVDRTPAVSAQVAAFCGAVGADDYAVEEGTVVFSGDAGDWGYRRMILHYAAIAEAAGGVDAFLIGSELRGLTTLRDGPSSYPFVTRLCELAADVRTLVGPATKITYGADWSEYFGHQPSDGSGDVHFHLDPLWAHDDIDAVGIDNYMPLADWRDGDLDGGNPDGAEGPYDSAALRAAITSGEGFDWYYASQADRAARRRTPISDGAAGKPWVFRYKDLVNWWSKPHFDRPGGTELLTPTAWVPGSKPVWFTELGCPAVDKGPNQPNVFPDPKSSENAIPHFSNGGRSDTGQHNFLAAHFDHWDPEAAAFDEDANPVAPLYGGRMVDAERIYCWAWDARPFPAFPLQGDVWADGGNWLRGHWISGRMATVELADLIDGILADHGLPPAELRGIDGTLAGYMVQDPATARGALQPLADLFGLAVSTTGERVTIGTESASPARAIDAGELVLDDRGATLERVRAVEDDLPAEAVLAYSDPFKAYQTATASGVRIDSGHAGQELISVSAAIEPGLAEALLADWMRRRWSAREQVNLALASTRLDVEPGTRIRLERDGRDLDYLVTTVETGAARAISARQVFSIPPTAWAATLPPPAPLPGNPVGPPLVVPMDLPMLPGAGSPEEQFRLAVRAKPWRSHAVYASATSDGFERRGSVTSVATVGSLNLPVPPGFEGRRDRAGAIEVVLLSGELESVSEAQLLAGANVAAIEALNGEWEIFQFQQAQEIAASYWRLTSLLRGEAGTEAAMRAGASADSRFVLLDAAVTSAGLRSGEAGLAMNWRVGPVSRFFGDATYRSFSAVGGLRARRPLAPVHVRVRRMDDGGVRLSWQRRSSANGARGISGVLPLGEAIDAFRIVVAVPGGAALRSVEVSASEWSYEAGAILSDFGSLPATAEFRVAQLSASDGPGDVAVVQHQLF